MRQIVEYIAKELVENPQAVNIREIRGTKSVLYEITTAPEDVGRIIGKDGRIIKSLRTFIKAVAARNDGGDTVEVEVID